MRGKEIVRKRLDHDIWTSIREKTYRQSAFHNEDFTGIAALLTMHAVDPISTWTLHGQTIPVTGAGYQWLHFMPANEMYVITAFYNAAGILQLWYIDMITGTGVDEDGVATFDDVLLDLVLQPDGNILVDDMDELIDAHEHRRITEPEYQLALATKDKLLAGLCTDVPALLTLSHKYKSILETMDSPDIDRKVQL